MAKHTFNADDDVQPLLTRAQRVLKDKSEFLNRLIRQHGAAMIKIIHAERGEDMQQDELRESQTGDQPTPAPPPLPMPVIYHRARKPRPPKK